MQGEGRDQEGGGQGRGGEESLEVQGKRREGGEGERTGEGRALQEGRDREGRRGRNERGGEGVNRHTVIHREGKGLGRSRGRGRGRRGEERGGGDREVRVGREEGRREKE